MGYDLTNTAGEYFRWNVLGWWSILNLAVSSGWTPADALEPDGYSEPVPWDGNYFHNASQQVTPSDANAIADALERLLASPDRNQTAQRVSLAMQNAIDDPSITSESEVPDLLTYPVNFMRGVVGPRGGAHIGTLAFDEGVDRYVRDFITFCRRGAFRIG